MKFGLGLAPALEAMEFLLSVSKDRKEKRAIRL